MIARSAQLVVVVACCFLVLMYMFAASPAKAAVVTGLEAHWAYDNGSGSLITSSVNSASTNATISASPNWVAGVIGGAHRFNGSNQAVSPGTPNLAPNIALPITLATWVRPENYASYQSNGIAQYGGLVNKWGSPDGNFAWALENTRNSFYDGAWKNGTAIVPQDQWSHVAVTVGGGTARYYLNGMVTATVSAGLFATATTNVYTLGAIAAGSGYRIQGAMDDSGVWSSAKSDAEIAAIHGLGLFSQVALNDPVLDLLLGLNVIGSSVAGVGPSNDEWFYTNVFAAGNPLPLQVGLAYTGADGYDYIVLQNISGEFFGLTTFTPPPAPEPSSAMLLGAGMVGLSMIRRCRRN